MKASDFEYRHENLMHFLLIGLAMLTYLRDRDDIVWSLVRNHSDSASWERFVFGIGALMLLASAALETWANAPSHILTRTGQSRYLPGNARILLVLAIGLLLPLSGCIILLAGEAILILRLSLRDRQSPSAPYGGYSWRSAFRHAASKWGLAISMIAFVWTLQDRIVEIGAALSVTLGLALNLSRIWSNKISHG